MRLKKLDKDPENAEKLGTAMMALIPVVKEAAGFPLMAAAWRLAGAGRAEDDASTLTGRGEEGDL